MGSWLHLISNSFSHPLSVKCHRLPRWVQQHQEVPTPPPPIQTTLRRRQRLHSRADTTDKSSSQKSYQLRSQSIWTSEYTLKSSFMVTTLQFAMNAKLSRQRFWQCHENGLIKTIQTIPQNLYLSLKLTSLYCGLRLILVYPNPQ